MKNKKGFTLIELLAVIVILGILLSVTTIAVNNIRKKQDEKNYQNIISSILTGAKQYATDNNLSTGSISVSDLLSGDYVDFDQSKYSNLQSKNVEITICSGNIKRKFSIEVDGTPYNDCGCESQNKDSVADELCTN